MSKLKSMLPFLCMIAFSYYVLPILIKDTGSVMLILLVVIPFICFLSSLLYGILKPFSILYPLLVAVLFLPSIFIFYNSTALVYTIAFGVIALAGSMIGRALMKHKNTPKQ